jgi:hypothetical protein
MGFRSGRGFGRGGGRGWRRWASPIDYDPGFGRPPAVAPPADPSSIPGENRRLLEAHVEALERQLRSLSRRLQELSGAGSAPPEGKE